MCFDLAPFRLPLSGQCHLDFLVLFLVRLWQAFEQAIWAGFECLAYFGEGYDRKWIFAVLQIADGLPVNSGQLRQTFLCETGPRAGRFNICSDEP